MNSFSPSDRRAHYEALARDALGMAEGTIDAGGRAALLRIAQFWTSKARGEEADRQEYPGWLKGDLA
jgi:hypothetical protein